MFGIESSRVFLFPEAVDGRLAHRGLSALVAHARQHDLLLGDMFLFISASRKAAKIIVFDGTGLLLLHKKLERGLFMKVPDHPTALVLTHKALEKILNGSHVILGYDLSIEQ